jgi:hypothetical protein
MRAQAHKPHKTGVSLLPSKLSNLAPFRRKIHVSGMMVNNCRNVKPAGVIGGFSWD